MQKFLPLRPVRLQAGFCFLLVVFFVFPLYAQESPAQVTYLTPDQMPAFLAQHPSAVAMSPEQPGRPLLQKQQAPAITLNNAGAPNIIQILVYQLMLLNQNPPIINSREAMLYFVYTSAVAFYLTIGAERLGVGFTYVAQNFYLAAATINTIVAIRFSLAALGINPGTPWPPSALMRIYFHWGNQPTPNPPPEFKQHDLQVGSLDDDASNSYADPTSPSEPQINQSDPAPNLDSPITQMTHFGCTVPNIDLTNAANPPVPGGYAGDKNACGPAAASNSLKWLQSLYPQINIPFSHRALLDSLSRYMQRAQQGGVNLMTFIRGKLDFIKRHNLPIQIKFQGQGATGNITDSEGQTMARNDNSGAYPTWTFLKQEVADTEDVEIFYKWHDGTDWRSHAVALTGVYETANGKRYIGIKHDTKQSDTGGTVQEFPEVTTDAAGRLVLNRHGRNRYISHIISESPGTPFSTTDVRGDIGPPSQFRLEQNYPNPFNPTTVIRFQLPARTHTNLKVYDVLGREVAELINKPMEAGSHSVNFNTANFNLTSGVYFYRLVASGKTATMRMTLLK